MYINDQKHKDIIIYFSLSISCKVCFIKVPIHNNKTINNNNVFYL